MLVYQQKTIEVAWEVEGFPGYGFGRDKLLYNLKTGYRLPMKLKVYTRGYYIAGRFVSLNQIKPRLRRPADHDLIF